MRKLKKETLIPPWARCIEIILSHDPKESQRGKNMMKKGKQIHLSPLPRLAFQLLSCRWGLS
jgi:hypothetical protein